jgi:hypothetical protein
MANETNNVEKRFSAHHGSRGAIIERDIEERFNRLEQKIDLIPDPFSKLSMIQIRKGGTGAARIRNIPLVANNVETAVVDDHGNFTTITHFHLTNAGTETIWYEAIPIPTDYVATGEMRLKYAYTNAGTTGDVYWTVLVKELDVDGTTTTTLLSDTSAVTVPTSADTMAVRSLTFTTLPTKDNLVAVKLDRAGAHGSDTNSSTTSLYSVWLEYVSFI